MLKSWTPGEMPDREEMKIQLEKTKSSLYDLQMKIKEHKLPVLVLFEGWSAAGKGSMIGKYETDPGRRQIYIPRFWLDGAECHGCSHR